MANGIEVVVDGVLMSDDDARKQKIRDRICNDFTYHAPFGDQPERYTSIRDAAYEFALLLTDLTPVSREQSLALTALQEAVMWANASMAVNETQE